MRYITTHPNEISTQIWNNVSSTEIWGNFSAAKNETQPIKRNQDLANAEVITLAVVIIITVIGNSIVLITLFQRRKKLTRMHLFILHLSVTDLFVAFFNNLPQMIWDITFLFLGTDLLCRLVTYLQSVAMYASSYVLVATAIDRYFAICHPLSSHKWTTARVHIMVFIAWMLSFLFSTPQLFIWSMQFSNIGLTCQATFDPKWTLKFYITWLTVAIWILPTIALTLFYGMMCFAVWKRGRSTLGSSRTRNRAFLTNRVSTRIGQNHLTRGFSEEDMEGQSVNYNRGISRAKVRSVALTLSVVACYFICWSPFFVCQMWAAWDENAPYSGAIYTILLLLSSLNSCTNPWIYMIFSVFQHRAKNSRFVQDEETTSVTVLPSRNDIRLMSMKKKLDQTARN
ncbi:cephalotocin receptor 1 [Octopus bimaculoides]|nr:cephalotocin receptor 1 [Octopus bimaculoides]